MKIITEKKLEGVRNGDLPTFVALDDAGLIIGPDETREEFAVRLEGLQRNIRELNEILASQNEINLYGVRLIKQNAIPKKVFNAARRITREHYGFGIDWVPGFFTNDRMGLLFAGCAMYPQEDFFAVFVIRKAFQNSEKWWIYSRTELITHELTHIAHIGFRTRNYEEYLAYQTSESRFRRWIGGMFRTPRDTYLVLGSMFCLLLAQIVNILVRPPEKVWALPIPLVFGAAFAVVLSVVGRYVWNHRRFRRAAARLQPIFGSRAQAVLFRCSEAEIKELAGCRPDAVRDWLENRRDRHLRWQVIWSKFGPD